MTEHHLYETDFVAEHDVGSGITLLQYDNGLNPGAWGVRHVCTSWLDPDEVDGRFVKVVAPRLTDGGHHVEVGDQGVTVHPSILCPDCGLHGYVTDGTWAAC